MSALVLRFRSHRPSTTVRKSVPDLPNRDTSFCMGERHAPLSPSRRSRLGPPLTRESRASHMPLAGLRNGLRNRSTSLLAMHDEADLAPVPSSWWPRLIRHLALDISPLRTSRAFRLLFFGQFVSSFGSAITFVVVPWQTWQ